MDEKEKIDHSSFSKFAIVATALFLVFICFISRDNLFRWFKKHREENTQKEEMSYLRSEIERKQAQLDSIVSSKEALERHARETAFFVEDGDEVYLIDE